MHTTLNRRVLSTLALAAGLALPAFALAQDNPTPKPKPAPKAEPSKSPKANPARAEKSPEMKRREKLKGHADTDGDGVLSDAERLAAKERAKARHAAIRTKLDANHDGKISPEEWQTVADDWKDFDSEFDRAVKSLDGQARVALIKTLDTNNNGTIDDAERAAIRARAEDKRFELIARFDANGDNTLSADERQALVDSLRQSRTAPPKRSSQQAPKPVQSEPSPAPSTSSSGK